MIKRSTLVAWLIILFPIMYLITIRASGTVSKISTYYDEVLGAVSMIYVTGLCLNKKLVRSDIIIYIVLLVLTVIGILSNVFSRLISNVFVVLVDIVALWKPLACYMAFKNYSGKHRENMINVIGRVFKPTILVIVFISIISQFFDIGATGDFFWENLKTFTFYGEDNLQVGWWLYCCILVLSATNISHKEFLFYVYLSVIPLFLTGSSTVWGWIILEWLLIFMLAEGKAFKKRYIVILAVILFLACYADISRYFLDSSSPRFRLVQGGITVANTYFPLGSGFATYGSDMAARNYSVLYEQFGWSNMWGLGKKNGDFLNDNFFASIVGQFGWVGLFFYFICLIQIFNKINTPKLKKYERVTCIATVLTIAISMIGSASGKSSMGVFTFSVLGLIASKIENSNKESIKQRDNPKKSKYIRGYI